jgi:hypothetical protein
MSQSDPIRDNYFSAAAHADNASNKLFYIAALISLLALLVDEKSWPSAVEVVQWLFVLASVALFAIGLASRLYFVPRAEDMRRKDFFSSALQVGLTHETTAGYYNNNANNAMRRLAANTMENSLFSKTIALKMAKRERAMVAIYLVVWLACVLNRHTAVTAIVTMSQILFSEQVISRWCRLEWLRGRCERVYSDLYALFRSNPTSPTFDAMALDILGAYEAAKVNAAVLLDSAIFQRVNSDLSSEWEKTQDELQIGVGG